MSFQAEERVPTAPAPARVEPDCQPATQRSGITGREPVPPFVDTVPGFLDSGGSHGGTEEPVWRAIEIGQRHGLVVTSLKRDWGNTGSDHHFNQTTSFAADMSNGAAPTPEMDATAAEIASALGVEGWAGGEPLNVHGSRMRAQLIWRWDGHWDHVHYGVRRVAEGPETIQEGDSGPAVEHLQRMLNAAGFPCEVDGIFGGQTREAVVSFQVSRGLDADGVVGPQTWAALGV